MDSPNGAADSKDVIADLMQLLKDQCQIVGRILGDVLSLQKMEEGKFVLEMAPFSPEVLIRNTVDSFRSTFDRKHQRVELQQPRWDLLEDVSGAGIAGVASNRPIVLNTQFSDTPNSSETASAGRASMQLPSVSDNMQVSHSALPFSVDKQLGEDVTGARALSAMLVGGMFSSHVGNIRRRDCVAHVYLNGRLLPPSTSAQQLLV